MDFFLSPVLLVNLKVFGFMECRADREGDHGMAMDFHLLLCILVTAILCLELYALFSQRSLSLNLNVPSSAYFFKLLSKRSQLFNLFFLFSLCLLLDFGKFLRSGLMAVSERSNSMVEGIHVIPNGDLQLIQDYDDRESDELCPEDQLFDEMSLRELIKAERRRADLAFRELEKERAAAATAAEEALSMILRLQSEKSSVEMEANHCRRLAEQKQQYDQQVIEFLRNVVMDQGIEMNLLERRVSLCSHCQLDSNVFVEEEEDEVSSGMEDELLLSSLEFDSWSL